MILTYILCFSIIWIKNRYYWNYSLMNKISPVEISLVIRNSTSSPSIYNPIFRRKLWQCCRQGKRTYAHYYFCCGCETKIIHIIFSYVFTSMSNVMKCGKTLSHWFYRVSNDIYSGVPPTLDDVWNESQMVHLFVDSIFVYNNGLCYKTKLNHILAASVLRLYDAFLGIIGN